MILQYAEVGGATVVEFTRSSWIVNVDGQSYHLNVSAKIHRRKSPVVTVYLRDKDGELQAIHCDIRNLQDGTVQIGVNRPPDEPGEVRIA